MLDAGAPAPPAIVNNPNPGDANNPNPTGDGAILTGLQPGSYNGYGPDRMQRLAYTAWMEAFFRERIGNRNPTFAPAGTFETKDGRYVQIAAGGDKVFQRLAQAMGMPELAEDRRYSVSRERIARADELEALLQDWIAAREFAEALRLDELAEMIRIADADGRLPGLVLLGGRPDRRLARPRGYVSLRAVPRATIEPRLEFDSTPARREPHD